MERTPVTPDELETFAQAVQAAVEAYYTRQGYTHDRPTICVMPGRKFARIVKARAHGRSVYGFVCRATGDLYKAAGWKGPARNFTRGNIRDPRSIATLSPFSIS